MTHVRGHDPAARMAVAVVSYNSADELRDCLRSVLAENPAEIVVVDNASTDATAAIVAREFPTVNLCSNEHNKGFGTAANQAVQASSAEYVLLLNADVALRPGAIATLTNHLDYHRGAGLVAPRLVNANGVPQRSCFPFPGALYNLLELSNAHAALRSLPLLGRYYLPAWNHDSHRLVPWAQGAALAFRRTAFQAVGGFDRSFFMYFEDADICERLRKSGWEIHFDVSVSVVHIGGASTRKVRVDMAVQFFESLLLFYRRHCSRVQFRQLLGILELAMLARLFRDGLRARIAHTATRRRRIAEDVSIWHAVLAHVRAAQASLGR